MLLVTFFSFPVFSKDQLKDLCHHSEQVQQVNLPCQCGHLEKGGHDLGPHEKGGEAFPST